MYFKSLRLAALCAVVALVCSQANAAVLLTEDFSYPDGDLVGNGSWVNHSGTGSLIQVVSEAAVLQHGGGSREDANTAFASQSGGVLTANFDLTVNSSAPIAGPDFEYFAHFYPTDDGFNYRSRTDVQSPNGTDPGDDYTLGIATSSSTGEVALPVDFTFGDVVPVTITFDIGGGTSSLTAGGSTVNTTDVSLGEIINGFALRQAGSTSNEMITIDNLVVSHVPEPTSLLLMIGGLLGMGAMRRK